MSLVFCTSNDIKFESAQFACQEFGVELERASHEVDEVQSEDPQYILSQKIIAMYKKIQKPLVVSDDSWSIPALNGFPGPYMKSVNHWFSGQDWVNLMLGHKDKRIFLIARLAYIDSDEVVTTFEETYERKFLEKASSRPGVPILQATSFPDSDIPNNERQADDPRGYHSQRKVWADFLNWYKTNQ